MSHEVNMNKQNGFTLIELILAMTFISVLLLTIALTIVQIATIYNRGVIAKEVNQSSRDIASDFETAINSSSSFSLNATDNHYVAMTGVGGRLCVGNYSYIWNYAGAITPTSLNSNRNVFVDPRVDSPTNTISVAGSLQHEISFVKVADSGGAYCIATKGLYPAIDQSKAVELLRTGDHSLALHYVDITTSGSATDSLSAQQLYTVTFVLGTSDTAAVKGTGDALLCKDPGEVGADTNYCSVQRFALVLRVASGVN